MRYFFLWTTQMAQKLWPWYIIVTLMEVLLLKGLVGNKRTSVLGNGENEQEEKIKQGALLASKVLNCLLFLEMLYVNQHVVSTIYIWLVQSSLMGTAVLTVLAKAVAQPAAILFAMNEAVKCRGTGKMDTALTVQAIVFIVIASSYIYRALVLLRVM